MILLTTSTKLDHVPQREYTSVGVCNAGDVCLMSVCQYMWGSQKDVEKTEVCKTTTNTTNSVIEDMETLVWYPW